MTKDTATKPRLHFSQFLCRRMLSSVVIGTPSQHLIVCVIVCEELTAWQAVTGRRMVYCREVRVRPDMIEMSPASRADSVPGMRRVADRNGASGASAALRSAVGSAVKRKIKRTD